MACTSSCMRPAGAWTELTLDPRFQGWDAVAHGGIVMHDPRRGDGLVRDRSRHVGRHRPAERRVPRTPSDRPADPRRRLGHRDPSAGDRPPAASLDAATGDVLATAEGTFIAAAASRSASSRRATGCGSSAEAAPDDRPDAPRCHRARPGAAPDRRAARPSRAPPRSRRDPRSRRARGGRRALGSALAEELSDPDASPRRSAPRFARSPIPAYRAGPGPRRARASGRSRRAPAAPGRRAPRLRRRPGADRARRAARVADRLLREPTLEPRWFAIGLLERTLARRAGAHLAAPPRAPRARPATGSRSTRSPTRGARDPRRAVPLGRARAARVSRRRAGSAGSSAPRSRRCRTSIVARAASRKSPRHGLPILATSSATPSPTSRRPCRGRSARWRSSISPRPTAFLRAEAASRGREHDGHRAWVIRDASRSSTGRRRATPGALEGIRRRARRPVRPRGPRSRRRVRGLTSRLAPTACRSDTAADRRGAADP